MSLQKENMAVACLEIARHLSHLKKRGACIKSVYMCTSSDDYTPLCLAVKAGDEEAVKLLLECGANVDAQGKDGKSVLHLAVEKGRSVIIEHVLKHCPDVNNKSNRRALNVAVQGYGKEYGKIVENLLQYGFTVNPEDVNDCKLLHAAVKKGYLKIVEQLLKYGTDVNMLYRSTSGNGYMSLHVAAKNKQEEVAKLLISYGADVNARDETGKTPIFYTTENADLKITSLLLEHNADVNYTSKMDITPLHVAAQKARVVVVKVLLKFGASIDSQDKYGRTPLHLAARKGHLEVVEVLLKFGASIYSQEGFGRTALHIACKAGHEQIVIALLEHCSDINIMSKNYHAPLDYVSGHGISTYEHIAEILKHHVIKMKAANLFLSKKNLLSISRNDEISDFQNECEEEIASMKSEKFSNANVSFYDILKKDISQLAMYAGNESIVQILRSDDYKVKFPIYASMINRNFRKGERRKELLEQGIEVFHFLFNNFPQLPHDCTEKIFGYLSDEDLRILIDACKPVSGSSPNTDINNVVIT